MIPGVQMSKAKDWAVCYFDEQFVMKAVQPYPISATEE